MSLQDGTGSKLNLYIEPFEYNTDFIYKNKVEAGNNSIQEWLFLTEYANRLQDDYVQVFAGDTFEISDIITPSVESEPYKFLYNMNIVSASAGTITILGNFGTYNESLGDFDIVVGDNTISLDLSDYINLQSILIVDSSMDFDLYLSTDLEVTCFEGDGVDVNVEGINVSVNTNLRSSITLSNEVVTIKLNKTQYAYTSDLILTDAEFNQLVDFANIARKMQRNVLMKVVVNETVGNRVAGIPDIATNEFILGNFVTTEKTGLYKYVTISYFNSKTNKVR